MTRTSLEVSGPAGSPMKTMLYRGLLFVVLGVAIDGKLQVPASR